MSAHLFNPFEQWLLNAKAPENAGLIATFCREFLFFGLKQARACLFVGLFFLAVLLGSVFLPPFC